MSRQYFRNISVEPIPGFRILKLWKKCCYSDFERSLKMDNFEYSQVLSAKSKKASNCDEGSVFTVILTDFRKTK